MQIPRRVQGKYLRPDRKRIGNNEFEELWQIFTACARKLAVRCKAYFQMWVMVAQGTENRRVPFGAPVL